MRTRLGKDWKKRKGVYLMFIGFSHISRTLVPLEWPSLAHRLILQMDQAKESRDRICHAGVWYWICPQTEGSLG